MLNERAKKDERGIALDGEREGWSREREGRTQVERWVWVHPPCNVT